MSDADFQGISGMSPGLPPSQAEIQGVYDFSVKFDVRELDSDYVAAKINAIIDPVLGQSILSDQRGASQKTFDKVNQDIALMALGN